MVKMEDGSHLHALMMIYFRLLLEVTGIFICTQISNVLLNFCSIGLILNLGAGCILEAYLEELHAK